MLEEFSSLARLPFLVRVLAVGELQESLIVFESLGPALEVIVAGGQHKEDGRGSVGLSRQRFKHRDSFGVTLLKIEAAGKSLERFTAPRHAFQSGSKLRFGLLIFPFFHQRLTESAIEVWVVRSSHQGLAIVLLGLGEIFEQGVDIAQFRRETGQIRSPIVDFLEVRKRPVVLAGGQVKPCQMMPDFNIARFLCEVPLQMIFSLDGLFETFERLGDSELGMREPRIEAESLLEGRTRVLKSGLVQFEFAQIEFSLREVRMLLQEVAESRFRLRPTPRCHQRPSLIEPRTSILRLQFESDFKFLERFRSLVQAEQQQAQIQMRLKQIRAERLNPSISFHGILVAVEARIGIGQIEPGRYAIWLVLNDRFERPRGSGVIVPLERLIGLAEKLFRSHRARGTRSIGNLSTKN